MSCFKTIILVVLTSWTLLPSGFCSASADSKTDVPDGEVGVKPNNSADFAGQTLIAGGRETKRNEFPGIVALLLNFTTSGLHFCGGNILDPSWILTAAHCVYPKDQVTGILVSAGDHYLDQLEPETEQGRGVTDIVIHPSYNPTTQANDVALLRLSEPLNMNQNVQPIALANPSYHVSSGPAVVAGWGNTSPNGESTNVLRRADLSFVDNRNCSISYAIVQKAVIDKKMVCASGPNRGVCQGDSGGPIMATSTVTGELFLVGTSSFIVICGDARFPSVFQRVSPHIDWIQGYVAGVKIDLSSTSKGAEGLSSGNVLLAVVMALCPILLT